MSQDHYSLIYTGRKKNRPKTQTKTNKPNTSRYAYKEESFHRFKKKKKRNFTYKVPTKSNAY